MLSRTHRRAWTPNHLSNEHEYSEHRFVDWYVERLLPGFMILISFTLFSVVVIFLTGEELFQQIRDLGVPIRSDLDLGSLMVTFVVLLFSALFVSIQLRYAIQATQVGRVQRYETAAAMRLAQLLRWGRVNQAVSLIQLVHPPPKPNAYVLEAANGGKRRKRRATSSSSDFVCLEFQILPSCLPVATLRWIRATSADTAFNVIAQSCGMRKIRCDDLLPCLTAAYYSRNCLVLVEPASDAS